jgi:LysR family glycine cleavage system transcriptional activator
LKLPPLNALRAFEAAARAGGYAAAAAELGVSPAAISQQVRNLERFFGKRLFERYNNRVLLTDAGREIHAEAAAGLRRIAEMSAHVLSGTSRARLTVSAPPSLVERWLAPRLQTFAAAIPGVSIDIRVEDDPVNFAVEGLDLRICYGMRLYPEMDVMPLFQDGVAPLASRAFMARHGLETGADLSGLDDACFIQTNWGQSFASHPGWSDWFRRKGAQRARSLVPGLSAGSSSLALELARLGLGVVLGQLELARADLASGALVQIDPDAVAIGHPYCAVTQPGQRHRASLGALLKVLQDDMGAGTMKA